MMLERRCSNLCKCCKDLSGYKQRVREAIEYYNHNDCAEFDVNDLLKELGLEDE